MIFPAARLRSRRRRPALARLFAVVTVVLTATLPVAPQTAQESAPDLSSVQGRGRACTQWFYDREFAKIEALGYSAAVEDALATLGGLAAFRERIDEELGAEVEVLEETGTSRDGLDAYMRTVRFEKYEGVIVVQWVFDAAGTIAGFAIRPGQ